MFTDIVGFIGHRAPWTTLAGHPGYEQLLDRIGVTRP
jgi:hypothetical protein